MKPRRKCDTPFDSFSEQTIYEPAQPVIEPGSPKEFFDLIQAHMAKEKAEDEEFFSGVVDKLRDFAAGSRKWLEDRGWQLVRSDPSVSRLWRKKVSGPKIWAYSSDPDAVTALERSSFQMYERADSAAHFAELGDWRRAIHYAYVAGFSLGLARARTQQAEEMKGRRRSGRRDEVFGALDRLAAAHGRNEIAKLQPRKLAALAPELEPRSGDEKQSLRTMLCDWRKRA